MNIRNATLTDHTAISNLLTQLSYPETELFLPGNLERMLNQPNSHVLVYDLDERVAGFIAFDFLTQLVVKGDFARISCFAVDENVRGKGVGKALEEHFANLAIERECDRIEVHCHSRRVDAHRFYYRQGYHESPKYLMKSLVDQLKP
ncbi:GNAT family N-acetyltransferase [Mucilaginibacter sp. FT3.2]|uniref:GNAT family N-acetyltransferase n=1 Tax=Mucilaginibacter sp. FT3.2 TaxID=2723090 RepID=UPI0016145044|nr:GNAT family N-acetyltransferase [Mucilaginibacter sp. FT3.2]MBB6229640.1 GNAT superfamily N-acetyltransferase [Mucilaginibacter sp. FT3.2]